MTMPESLGIPDTITAGTGASDRIRRWTVLGAKLILGPLALLTLVILVIQFGAWRIQFEIAGPFAAETNPARHSLILEVPKEGPTAWWRQPLIGDTGEKPRQSNLELRIVGREMGPPHSQHEAIRTGKTTGFSHWGARVIFSLPADVANAPGTIATLRYSVRPRAWVTIALTMALMVAGALLGWALNRRAISAFLSHRRGSTSLVEPLHTSRMARIVGATLFAVFLALALQLRQRDLEFPIEPDFIWQTIETWRNFFSTLDPKILPRPAPHVYLDGQYIAYGLADVTLRWIADKLIFLRATFPNDASYALGAAMLVNIVAYAAASTIFFFSIFRLTRNEAIAAVTAFGYFLAPQMMAINIARVDFLNTLPLSVIFYSSCVLALGQARQRHAVALGAAMAFAASLKFNGLFFGVIPACAALAALNTRSFRHLIQYVAISLATFSIAYVTLMIRFFYYLAPAGVIQYYSNAMELLRPWAAILVESPFYYNVGLMMDHGIGFIILYLFCAMATIVVGLRQRSGAGIFLGLCFVTLSIAGMASMKYGRGGYHLLPIFFAVIAFTASEILRAPLGRTLRISIVGVGAAVFAVGLLKAATAYSAVVVQRKEEVVGLDVVKRQPREWLVAHFPRGTRICIQTSSHWTLPDLDGFVPTEAPLALPYQEPQALSHAAPPSLEEVKNHCRLVVTSDYHRRMFGVYLRRASSENAERWSRFFDALNRKFPPVVFSSPNAAYAKEVYINDLGAQ